MNKKSISLVNLFNLSFIVTGILIVGLGIFGYLIYSNQVKVLDSQNTRYDSYLLADELRQSSDDLTRLARTYVVTADPKYEKYYMDILAIRNGEKARPENYHRIYWDLVTPQDVNGQKVVPPFPDSDITKPLQEMMKEAGFTAQEFEALGQAQANSDSLVNLEVIAMDAVKGKIGEQEKKNLLAGESLQQYAIRIMHSEDYHKYKADIMKYNNVFLDLVETRTNADVLKYSANQRNSLIALAGFLLIIITLVIILFVTEYIRISKPLKSIPIAIETVAGGDLTKDLAVIRGDEFGRISVGFNEMIASVRKMIANILSMLGNTTALTEEVNGYTEQVNVSSEEISKVIMSIADGASELVEKSNLSKASTEKLSHSVDSISEKIESINQSTQQMMDQNNRGIDSMEDLDDKFKKNIQANQKLSEGVRNLADKSDQIGSIVVAINNISEQTNLLALNAAIEAARAGDAGKGFAIVADEVRKLAEQSKVATDEIQTIINDITDIIGDTEKDMVETREIMEISDKSLTETKTIYQEIYNRTTKTIEDIRAVNHNIKDLGEVKETNEKAIVEMSGVAEHTAVSTEEIAASIEEQTAIINHIRELMAKLSEDMKELETESNEFTIQ